MSRLLLVALLLVTTTLPRTAYAQPSAATTATADAWLNRAVRSEASFDEYGRYIALGLYGVLGTFLLIAPPLIANGRADIGPKGAAVGMGAGGLLLGAGASSLFISDPYEAERWSTMLGGLGYIGLTAALSASSLEARTFLPELSGREDNGNRPDTLSTIYGVTLLIGLLGVGQALSTLVVDLALPSQSASALRAQIADLAPDERHDRIREFLVRREQRRAWQQYSGAAATFLAGGLTVYAAQSSATGGAEQLGTWTGVAIIASGVGRLISYWLSDNSVSLLDDGLSPQ